MNANKLMLTAAALLGAGIPTFHSGQIRGVKKRRPQCSKCGRLLAKNPTPEQQKGWVSVYDGKSSYPAILCPKCNPSKEKLQIDWEAGHAFDFATGKPMLIPDRWMHGVRCVKTKEVLAVASYVTDTYELKRWQTDENGSIIALVAPIYETRELEPIPAA